jgi:hypothetical protein
MSLQSYTTHTIVYRNLHLQWGYNVSLHFDANIGLVRKMWYLFSKGLCYWIYNFIQNTEGSNTVTETLLTPAKQQLGLHIVL